MSNLRRDIGSDDFKIEEIVTMLRKDELLVPTFQREFVWDPRSIVKLWDSLFRFYPIASLLYWETDSYLHTHRKLGGFVFPHDPPDPPRSCKPRRFLAQRLPPFPLRSGGRLLSPAQGSTAEGQCESG